MKKTLLILIAASAVLFSCNTAETPQSAEVNDSSSVFRGITYEIFIQSFADSDGDGIGDFKGATAKLDYLTELGIEGLWLMPIMPSPSYHKYDVTDYYDVHPDYGTLDDFKTFVNEAHKRNIRVFIDLVMNHSSSQHPWFIGAASGAENPYRHYYVWADRDSIADQLAKKEISFDSDNIHQWHAPGGDTTQLYYYGFFNGAMPDMNFDNPVVREEFYKIGKFWLSEVDVDGFRLDAAKHIYPDDRMDDNAAFWQEFLAEMKSVKPEVYTVGEVWSNAETVGRFVPGFKSLFDFDMAFSVLESVKNEKNVAATISGHGWKITDSLSFTQVLKENRDRFQQINTEFEDAVFLSNHDQNRFRSYLDGDLRKSKLAASVLFTLPGQPYLYYGEEIGMLGMKPDPEIREPMIWDIKEKDTFRTSWENAVHSNDSTVVPAAVQMNDPGSIMNHYKKWISFRKNNPVLYNGEILPVESSDDQILIFRRVYKEDTLTIVHNLSGTHKSFNAENDEILFTTDNANSLLEGKMEIAPYSSVVIK